MATFHVPCTACGEPVDTGVVDLSRSGRGPSWVPALTVERGCDACGHRDQYSLKKSVRVPLAPLA